LVTVIDPSTLIVHAKVPLSNFSRVRVGMKAQVTPPVLSSHSLPGKVISVVPQADAQTDTFEVWVQVDNKEQVLLPGMSAFVNIQGQTRAFVVPRLAVLDADHQARVFQIRDGHAVMSDVHVIGRDEDSIFVDSGVVPGETIVLFPLGKLHDGQGVHVTGVQHS
jgi:Cu(I)/Ag(I) efflux system membrane fusion protein